MFCFLHTLWSFFSTEVAVNLDFVCFVYLSLFFFLLSHLLFLYVSQDFCIHFVVAAFLDSLNTMILHYSHCRQYLAPFFLNLDCSYYIKLAICLVVQRMHLFLLVSV